MSARRTAGTASLRTKFLGIVVVGALLPLAVVGIWLSYTTQRSGEDLLRSRLDTTLARATREVGTRWIAYRSALLDLAQDTTVYRVILDAGHSRARADTAIALPLLTRSFAELRAATQLVLFRDARDTARWVLAADAAGRPVLVSAADSLRVSTGSPGDALVTRMPITPPARRDARGIVEGRLHVAELVPASAGNSAGAGAVISVVDRANGTAVAPLPFDAALLQSGRFAWGGEEWITARRSIEDPYIELVVAAPLTPFVLPFRRAARTGVAALIGVAVAGLVFVTLLTRRVTRSLVELAGAAEAVARGDLDREVVARTGDEVGRLAHAFNAMTDSLRRTLAELSQRQAVAAVGEFASALAHEIRNPLSAIRLNLQHVEEQLDAHPSLRDPVGHSLRDIARLESTVAGALRLARTGRMHMEPLALSAPLSAAARAAEPEFRARGVTFEMVASPTDGVRGNSAALEQLFLNLLLNAAQATPSGGRVGAHVRADQASVTATIWDTGAGFASGARERAFEPFFTTKAEGSGLGLTVARRITTAHGGTIEIESVAGEGTSVLVRLPRIVRDDHVAEVVTGSTPVLGT
jgi:two-component system sensor histidine kinase AtoS